MGPAPVTKTRLPVSLPAWFTAWSATESGSAQAITGKEMLVVSRMHWVSAAQKNSAKPPET
jgi:hypothetical protein